MTLSTRISLYTTVMITVGLCIAGGLYIGFLKVSVRNALFDGLRSSSIASAEAVSRFLNDSSREAQAVAFALPVEAIQERNTATIQQKLKKLAEIFPHFDNGMFVLDAEGRLWADYPVHPERKGDDFSYREYFQRTKKDGVGIIGTPYASARTKIPVITFTAPLKDSSNNLIGVLGCSARLLSPDAGGIVGTARIGRTGYIFVFDKTRLMVIHPDSSRILQRDVPAGSNVLFDAAIEKGFSGVGETVNSRGVEMIAAVSQIPETGWILIAQQPKEEAYEPIGTAVRRILMGILFACLGSILVTTLIVGRITGSLLKLREAAVGLGHSVERVDGNWEEETQSLRSELKSIIGHDEIGDLAAAFIEMCDGLEKTLFSLRKSAEEWENTFKSVPDEIMLLDREYRVLRSNRSTQELTGKKEGDAVGRLCYELLHGTGAPVEGCPHAETLLSGRTISRQIKDRSGRFLKVITAPLLDKEGTITGTVHVTRDITQRKIVDETLRRTKDMLQALIRSAPVAIDMVDSDLNVLMWNPAAEHIFGWRTEEVIGKPHPAASNGIRVDYLATIEAAFDGRILNSVTTQRNRKDGSLIDISLSAAPVYDGSGKVSGAMEILVDVTEKILAEQEKSRLETELRQSHKLEAIGTLAGGIAHDFNNILSAIIGYSELTLPKMPEGTPSRHNIEQVLKAGLRAKDLVKQILTFSRKTETEKKVLQLAPIIEEALTLIRASLPATIEIKKDLHEDKGVVLADPTQIHQVIMNLCTNAAHAMSEKGGVLQITLERIDAEKAPHPELALGAYMRLTVKDTGRGMNRETMDRIFDPYFTTKQVGVGGTGLGLAIVRGIVKSYGGAVGVESKQGVGSRFDLFFPVVDEEEPATQYPLNEDLPSENARILFVDDEAYLVDMARQMLELLGCTVTTRTSSVEALDTFRANSDRFDLIITDMTMPNMTGVELSREIRRIRANMPIILCTGFSETATPEKVRASGIQELVMKPFAIASLGQAIRRALDKHSVSS